VAAVQNQRLAMIRQMRFDCNFSGKFVADTTNLDGIATPFISPCHCNKLCVRSCSIKSSFSWGFASIKCTNSCCSESLYERSRMQSSNCRSRACSVFMLASPLQVKLEYTGPAPGGCDIVERKFD